jgi:hypothetical protein
MHVACQGIDRAAKCLCGKHLREHLALVHERLDDWKSQAVRGLDIYFRTVM